MSSKPRVCIHNINYNKIRGHIKKKLENFVNKMNVLHSVGLFVRRANSRLRSGGGQRAAAGLAAPTDTTTIATCIIR